MRKYALVVLAFVGCTEAKTANRDPAHDESAGSVPVPVLVAEDSIAAQVIRISASALEEHAAVTPRLVATIAGAGTANAFFTISSISVSADSDLYVVDEQANTVYRFTTDGKFEARIGGTGDGPGELQYPRFAAEIGDSLFIYDARALNVFRTDGKFVERSDVRPPKAFGAGMAESYAVARGRIIIGHSLHYARRKTSPFRDTLALSSIDVRHSPSVSDPFVFVVGCDKYHALNADVVPAFQAIRYSAVSDDGRVFVTGRDGASINVVSDAAAQQRRIIFDTPRRAVTAKDRRAYLDELEGSVKKYGARLRPQDRTAMIAAFRDIPAASQHPVVAEIVASPEGELLVHRRDLDEGNITTWEYLAADFKPRARLRLPKNFKPSVVRHGAIFGVTTSELDEKVVSVYRLT